MWLFFGAPNFRLCAHIHFSMDHTHCYRVYVNLCIHAGGLVKCQSRLNARWEDTQTHRQHECGKEKSTKISCNKLKLPITFRDPWWVGLHNNLFIWSVFVVFLLFSRYSISCTSKTSWQPNSFSVWPPGRCSLWCRRSPALPSSTCSLLCLNLSIAAPLLTVSNIVILPIYARW